MSVISRGDAISRVGPAPWSARRGRVEASWRCRRIWRSPRRSFFIPRSFVSMRSRPSAEPIVVEAVTVPSPRQASALRQVWGSPLYRGATIALFLSGLGPSAAAPQIVLFLVKELGTPLPVAGLFYLTSLAAPIAGYLVGSYSDRTGGRLGLFRVCAIAGFLGWAGIALSSAAWMPFVISALALAFSGATASQIFAAIHDDLNQT